MSKMRKITATLFSSLDGVVEAPDQWQHAFDDQMGAAVDRSLRNLDAVLIGRRTYTEWAAYWPTSTDEPFATLINQTPRYVASTTLKDVDDWPRSTLIEGSVTDYVARLRQQDGGEIAIGGSPTLVRSLLHAGLLDELTLLIHPVVAGSGRMRLFADDAPLTNLKLVQSESTSSGTIIACYRTTP
jgi:dihydrofolate reductase